MGGAKDQFYISDIMESVCSLCLGGSEGHIDFMSNENQVGVSASTSPPLAGGRGASK